MEDTRLLTRAERRAIRKLEKANSKKPGNMCQQNNKSLAKPFKIKTVMPKTKNQEKVFREFSSGQNLMIHGFPGTGKTFLSLYLALNEIEEYGEYQKVVIIRSTVPSRDIGFLPGSIKEKSEIYEAPYYDICSELYGRGDAYQILKQKGLVEFHTTSFLRGLTISDAIIILDEAQNATSQELNTVCSRVGNNSRLIVSGDLGQNDLVYKKNDYTGLVETMDVLKKMRSVSFIEFTADDVVRSGFVKEYLLAKYSA